MARAKLKPKSAKNSLAQTVSSTPGEFSTGEVLTLAEAGAYLRLSEAEADRDLSSFVEFDRLRPEKRLK